MMRSREMMMRSASVGEGMMITSQEYRRMAEECFGWAREAQTDEVRLCYVNLAKTWLQAASWMENVSDRHSRAPLTGRPSKKRKAA
jgi:hypothetical protein